MTLTVGSLFAGVGGFDLALERVGLKVIWNCEIDAKCRKVLARHWPGVPRFKDVRTVTGGELRTAGLAPDVIVGGFPCTDVSVAGKRAGLAGEQSRLFFEFARLLDELRPAWCLVENVPGLLSSHRGADMGTVVGHLVDIGYGVAWRVLDAQYFGVAQRRRRVFVVGCLGDRARAAEVLLVGEGGGGDPPARRAAGEDVAGGTGGCVAGDGELVTELTGSFGNGGADDNKAQAGWLVPAVSNALCSNRGQRNDHNEQTFLPVAFHMTQDPITSDDMSPAIGGVKPTTGYSTVGVAYRKARKIHGPLASAPDEERWEETEVTDTFSPRDGSAPTTAIVSPALTAGAGTNNMAPSDGNKDGYVAAVHAASLAVRRLTPLECLRLQGFPDDWLDGLGLADSVKYRMVGNAVAVPVVEWLGQRLVIAHIDGDERA